MKIKKYDNFYSSSKAKTIINESDIDDVFKPIYTTVIKNIPKFLGKIKTELLIQPLIILLAFQNIIH